MPAQDLRPRVLGLVDAVAEAHQPVAAVERRRQPGIDVVGRADRVQHVQHLRRRPAVQRPLQGADRAGQRRAHVGLRRGDHAGREGRGVHAVVGQQDEVGLERLPVPLLRLVAEELVEVALGRVQPGLWRDRLLPLAQAEKRRQDRREAAPRSRSPDRASGVPSKMSGSAAPRAETPVRSASIGSASRAAARRTAITASGRPRLASSLRCKSASSARVRQVADPEQMGDFFERGLAGQLVDVVAAVDQPALFAEDVAERRRRRDDALQVPPASAVPVAQLGAPLPFSLLISLRSRRYLALAAARSLPQPPAVAGQHRRAAAPSRCYSIGNPSTSPNLATAVLRTQSRVPATGSVLRNGSNGGDRHDPCAGADRPAGTRRPRCTR